MPSENRWFTLDTYPRKGELAFAARSACNNHGQGDILAPRIGTVQFLTTAQLLGESWACAVSRLSIDHE